MIVMAKGSLIHLEHKTRAAVEHPLRSGIGSQISAISHT